MTQLPKPNPRCACCGDAYDTRWLCPRCRRDPANTGWLEAPVEDVSLEMQHSADQHPAWNESAVWRPSALFCDVARLLVEEVPQNAIARRLGCSRQYVASVADEVGLTQPSPRLDAPTRSRTREVLLQRVRFRRIQERSHGGGLSDQGG